ncbi:hypothetical protein [Brumimicrobium mesophilum]|uniref:hypothetical protein n=1 Tax=Brumimicrobium mesophilum TaxID=392717 RepID=UPI000D142B12|nr:hypothetical protein [Brumimicrobium mesophilum]
MKQIIIGLLLGIFLLHGNTVNSQISKSLHFGVSESLYSEGGKLRFKNFKYTRTSVQLGVNLDLESNNFRVFGVYELYGNLKFESTTEEYDSFLFASHLMGVGVENRFWDEKRVSLLVGFSALTEIASNYRNGYISEGSPVYPISNYTYELLNSNSIIQYQDFYYSTPFASSFYIGADVQIYKGLHFNLSLENNFRIMKTREVVWDPSSFEGRLLEDIINEQEIETTIIDQLGFRFGLTYNL